MGKNAWRIRDAVIPSDGAPRLKKIVLSEEQVRIFALAYLETVTEATTEEIRMALALKEIYLDTSRLRTILRVIEGTKISVRQSTHTALKSKVNNYSRIQQSETLSDEAR